MALLALSMLATASLGSAPPAGAAAVAPDCAPVGHRIAAPPAGRLFGVAAAGPDDVWAVGDDQTTIDDLAPQANRHPLIAHWIGSGWITMPLPPLPPATPNGELHGVAVLAPDNIWAVGAMYSATALYPQAPLILHWNGQTWQPVAVYDPGHLAGGLNAVTAANAGNIWAVGDRILYYDGTTWTFPSNPIPPSMPLHLTSVVAPSFGEAWAIGTVYIGGGLPAQSLLLHWRGLNWEVATAVTGLNEPIFNLDFGRGFQPDFAPAALAAVPGQHGVWAVGRGTAHWDGFQWSTILTPSPEPLTTIAVTASGDAWAPADLAPNSGHPGFIYHWDGKTWRGVPSGFDSFMDHAARVAVAGAQDVWIVGTESHRIRGASSVAGLVSHVFSPCAVPAARVPDPHQAGVVYFPAVQHTLRGVFRSYWEQHGGLAQFGYPLTEEFPERSLTDGKVYTVQYFERNRFESHPENAGTPYAVLLGLLGRTVTEGALGRTAPFLPLAAAPVDRTFFPATGHSLAPEFAAYWQQHGGLAVYGYPISEPYTEANATDGKPYLVQYFERNRLEYHPELPPAYHVSLGLLGVPILQDRGWIAR